MCGIAGIIHGDPQSKSVGADLHDALFQLQHRGQDACGIATCGARGRIYQCKGNGKAERVFKEGDRVTDLPGFMGIGHLRYPTAGSSANAEAQPFYVNSPYGICFSHNGNLINAPELKEYLDREAHRHINTHSDSELMLNVYASELNETGKDRVNAEDCFAALSRTYEKCQGAWACAAMIAGFGLLAFRDPYGIRPLVLGTRQVPGQEKDYMVASESVALQYFGCRDEDIVDIKPGQAVIIEKGKVPEFRQVHKQIAYVPDLFEYLYFARPDSVMDGILINNSRLRMGDKLAKTIKSQLDSEILDSIDVVMPVPETSNVSARRVAAGLGKQLADGFVKNRYIHRTFIMPNQKLRKTGVRRKLSAMASEFRGRNVLIIDDSIVRGTTSKEIVQMAREAGAKNVYLASASPPITHVHIYGIDLASSSELIAYEKNTKEIAEEIGAEAVVYQTLEDLEAAVAELSPRQDQKFEVGVFCGKYVTPVGEGYFEHLEQVRGQGKKRKAEEEALRAIANGVAKEDDLRLAVQGADLDSLGFTKPVSTDRVLTPKGINGTQKQEEEKRRRMHKIVRRESTDVRNTQDISLDNLNDHETER